MHMVCRGTILPAGYRLRGRRAPRPPQQSGGRGLRSAMDFTIPLIPPGLAIEVVLRINCGLARLRRMSMRCAPRMYATATALVLLAIGVAMAAPIAAAPIVAAPPPAGDALAGMDRSVQPGVDFYEYANGGWSRSTEIPADLASTGV